MISVFSVAKMVFRKIATKIRQPHIYTLHPCRGVLAVVELALNKMIDFFANGLEVIQSEIDDGVTDISDLIHFL
jgi:hypothetical protein